MTDQRQLIHLLRTLCLGLVGVLALGLVTPIINAGDSVTYAALSQHMVQSGDWVRLVLDGADWLDKPHFPFWVTAASFWLLGVNAPAYVLPGLLFVLLGGWSTWRLTRELDSGPHAELTAWLALLIYLSVFQIMDNANGIKAEAYLLGCIMSATLHWWRLDQHGRLRDLWWGALFAALALMTKGLFTLVTITSGFVVLWLTQRRLANFWHWRWWLALLLALLLSGPELWALYAQFDAHPDKLVSGRTGVSGIRFFLWDSQFGRFFNSGPITNPGGTPYFFAGVFLWAFLPWVGVAALAVIREWRIFGQRTPEQRATTVFLLGSFGVTFVLFSWSSFQLDYYTVIIYPFIAIFCARDLAERWLADSTWPGLRAVQWVMSALLLALTLACALSVAWPLGLTTLAGVWVLALLLARRVALALRRVLVWPVLSVALLYGFLTVTLTLTYREKSLAYNAARQLRAQPVAEVLVLALDPTTARELALYTGWPTRSIARAQDLPNVAGRACYLLARAEQLPELVRQHWQPVGQGRWVAHKTGTLPRLLQLARDDSLLEDIRLLRCVK
ncbi:MAG: glycosyltransferase family 39 protein [Rhodoferax sp.]|nr:glycosyltransferase family 39 protein [Rhodoferax sp.]